MADGYWFMDSPLPTCRVDDRYNFDRAIEIMRADVTALAVAVTNDQNVRILYQQQISQAAKALERDAFAGRITWQKAANEASALRNDIMEMLRGRTSPIGRAMAESMKKQGLTRETLLGKYTERLFGKGKVFSSLSKVEQDKVYGEIVKAAARSNPKVNAKLVRWSRIGKGLIVLSIGISVYNIATAEDPGAQAVEEVAVTGAGIVGGMAGGAAAGLVCGPGAPVCVTVGALLGGALAAFGVSFAF